MKIYAVDLYEYFGLEKGDGCQGELVVYQAEEYASEKKRLRPAVLIMPGGGYTHVSKREAEPVALRFLSAGFNAFILKYTTGRAFPVQLVEAELAMAYIRKNAIELSVKKDKIACLGFSAGGHLAATLGTMPCEYESKPDVERAIGLPKDKRKVLFRPNALVLCYPVILSGEYAHKGSIEVVSGGDNGLIEALSLEKRVDKDTPPSFIWHTASDGVVPVQNSLEFAKSLADKKIKFSLRIYPEGEHGSSLCDAQSCERDYRLSKDALSWSDEAVGFLLDLGFVIG